MTATAVAPGEHVDEWAAIVGSDLPEEYGAEPATTPFRPAAE